MLNLVVEAGDAIESLQALRAKRVEDQREELRALLEALDHRIVVLVDAVDRLDPPEIQVGSAIFLEVILPMIDSPRDIKRDINAAPAALDMGNSATATGSPRSNNVSTCPPDKR